MKNIINFLKKRKYFLFFVLIIFVLFNLFYFESKCESFADNGLINTDNLVEKIKKKTVEYEGVLNKMNKLKQDLDKM